MTFDAGTIGRLRGTVGYRRDGKCETFPPWDGGALVLGCDEAVKLLLGDGIFNSDVEDENRLPSVPFSHGSGSLNIT